MKRFVLFAGSTYHPYGGWFDFQDSFDDLDEATTELNHLLKICDYNWWHMTIGEKVVESAVP